jgi:hypothetical protein
MHSNLIHLASTERLPFIWHYQWLAQEESSHFKERSIHVVVLRYIAASLIY